MEPDNDSSSAKKKLPGHVRELKAANATIEKIKRQRQKAAEELSAARATAAKLTGQLAEADVQLAEAEHQAKEVNARMVAQAVGGVERR